MDFRGFESSIILRGEILMSIGDFPESLSQAILVGIILVGRLGEMCTRKVMLTVPPLVATTVRREGTRGKRREASGGRGGRGYRRAKDVDSQPV